MPSPDTGLDLVAPRWSAVRWACAAEYGSLAERRVLVALATIADDDLEGRLPGLAELHRWTGVDVRELPGIIQDLAAAGHLTYTGRSYRLTPQLELWDGG